MNQLSEQHIAQSVFTCIKEAVQKHQIPSKRGDCLWYEAAALTKQLVMRMNHKLSSSLSADAYTDVTKTIDTFFFHGISNRNLRELNDHSITYFYELGKNRLDKAIASIQKLLAFLQNQKGLIINERCHSVLFDQIPKYLTSLTGYDGIFHYYTIDEDLDYPLLDGLPLFQDMYGRDGVDLVLEYSKRLFMESQFCLLFLKDIPALIQQYEELYQIPAAYASFNLCEVLLIQAIGHALLYDTKGILLQENDVTRIHHRLAETLNPAELIHACLLFLFKDFPLSLAYFIKRENIIQQNFEQFQKFHHPFLIYEKKEAPMIHATLDEIKEDSLFMEVLHTLQSIDHTPDRIRYLKTQKLSIYDLFDLFENEVFMENEYPSYFASLSLEEIALMIKARFPEWSAFSTDSSVPDDWLFDDQEEAVWIHELCIYVHSLSPDQRNYLFDFLDHLKIA